MYGRSVNYTTHNIQENMSQSGPECFLERVWGTLIGGGVGVP